MLFATNRGAGQNVGFPDVCLTPAGPAPVPIPYPNLGMHVMAVPFSLNVYWTFMNALNLGSKLPITLGMNAGVAHPMYMMMGGFTLGSFVVLVNFLPAIHLCAITNGNNYNNPIGGVLVPSVTNVFLTLRGVTTEAGELSPSAAQTLTRVLRDEGDLPAVEARRLDGETACLRLRAFPSHVGARVFRALRELGSFDRLVIDLRGNPGGDAEAALQLAGDFVEPGTPLALRREADGHEKELVGRLPEPYRWPVALVVDAATASAAELFAGALQASGRAIVWGRPTHGKGTAQRLVPGERGGAAYATVAEYLLPGGRAIDGVGLTPDVGASDGETAGARAIEAAAGALDRGSAPEARRAATTGATAGSW